MTRLASTSANVPLYSGFFLLLLISSTACTAFAYAMPGQRRSPASVHLYPGHHGVVSCAEHQIDRVRDRGGGRGRGKRYWLLIKVTFTPSDCSVGQTKHAERQLCAHLVDGIAYPGIHWVEGRRGVRDYLSLNLFEGRRSQGQISAFPFPKTCW